MAARDPRKLARVCLMGGDGFGWALDEYLKLTTKALGGIAEPIALADADVVHSMWWRGLLPISREQLRGKRVLSYISEEAVRFLAAPDHLQVMGIVGRWLARTTKEVRQLTDAGIDSVHVPHMIDLTTFGPLVEKEPVEAVRERWSIPRSCYLIGSFQRDTEGVDLASPKLVKGPDIFAEIVRSLWQRKLPIHVVIAGPRRFWLRRRLAELGIPYTYIGQSVAKGVDDLRTNTLSRNELNVLYNLIDMYVVGSRSENAPDSVLEAAAARCKIISTPVGIAPDVLVAGCIYRSVSEAARIVADDIEQGTLLPTVTLHRSRAETRHSPSAVAAALRPLYQGLDAIAAYEPHTSRVVPEKRGLVQRAAVRLRLLPRHPRLTLGLWHTFYRPPYGGGNQFMLALAKALPRQGIDVVENARRADVHLLQSLWFDVEGFERLSARSSLRVVHRIAGPIWLHRGFDRDKDDRIFSLNRRFAHATVVQSAWSLRATIGLDYRPVRPVLIPNAADPEIFHAHGRSRFERGRKVRLISSSWSDNVRKGGAIYKWIDQHLDWSRYEYTFVGRTNVRFERIRHLPPVASSDLADLLRAHDIFICASRIEACSNALTEALTCGLPALYLESSSNPEVVGYGGLPFQDESQILPQLDALVADYDAFRRLIAVPTMDEIAERYAELLREVARSF
jgi:glycosyltransferase involved in cell wall biosynthesis